MMEHAFTLSGSFLEDYVGQQPTWGPLGYVTYKRTYARRIEDLTPRLQELAQQYKLLELEEWWLTCVRVVEGVYTIQKRHCASLNLPWSDRKAQRSAQEMFRRMWDFKWLPPGRGLWMMGMPYVIERGGAALNNCAFQTTENIDVSLAEPFTFIMDMSMLGVGVGFDTKGEGKLKVRKPKMDPEPFVVQDTREGWVELVQKTLDAYSGDDLYPEKRDYSLVRPAGSPIRGFGGVASGPEPLEELVVSISKVLDNRIGEKITSADIVDIANLIGRCVVAGNVRRSAELALGRYDDEDFLALKDPENEEALFGWRWASNNSVLAKVGADYSNVAARTAKNGEPGYMWLENAQAYGRMGRAPDFKDHRAAGTNPCSEQTLESSELCCLVENFPSMHEDYKDFEKTLKYSYLYAKSVTLVPTHNYKTNNVMLRNRRIGCSMSGIVQAMEMHGRRKFFNWCDKGYDYVSSLDETYSQWLCVRTSIKKTSVKPSGTVSLLPGVTPGIHYPHSEYYMRVIRFSSDSPMLAAFRNAGYRMYDLSPNEPNTHAVYFPVKEKHFDRSKSDVSIWEQMENAAQMQQYWADNQVSVTVTFKKDEASQIEKVLEMYETRLKSVSFLPISDHGYKHAPYQECTKEEYEAYAATLLPLDLSVAQHEVTERFCDGDKCEIPSK